MGTHWTNRRSPGALAQGQILVAVLHLCGLHLWSNPTNKTTNISAEKIHKRQRFEIPWTASQLTAGLKQPKQTLETNFLTQKTPPIPCLLLRWQRGAWQWYDPRSICQHRHLAGFIHLAVYKDTTSSRESLPATSNLTSYFPWPEMVKIVKAFVAMLDVLPKSKIPKPCMPFNPLFPISSNPLRVSASYKHSVTNATSMIKLCYTHHVLHWLCTFIWHIISRAQDMLPILFAAFGSNCPSWNNESLTCSCTSTNHHCSAHGHNTSRNSNRPPMPMTGSNCTTPGGPWEDVMDRCGFWRCFFLSHWLILKMVG